MLTTIDSTIKLWDVTQDQQKSVFEFPFPNPISARFHSNAQTLIISSKMNFIFMIDLLSKKQTKLPTSNPITSLAFSNEGNFLTIGNENGHVTIYEFNSMDKKYYSNAHRSQITCLQFTSDSSRILAGDSRGKLSISPFSTPKSLKNWSSTFGKICDFVVNQNDLAIASGNTTKLYDLVEQKVKFTFQVGPVSSTRFHPFQNQILINGITRGKLQLLDLREGREKMKHEFENEINSMDIRFDGNLIGLALNGNGVHVFDLRNKQLRRITQDETFFFDFSTKRNFNKNSA